MATKPLNLVERAAHRLRDAGTLEASSAHLLQSRARIGGAVATRPDAGPPTIDSPPRDLADPSHDAPERGRARFVDGKVLEAAGVIDWSQGRNRPSEEFRIVQAQIMRTAFAATTGGQGLPNLVMVTSARPGEGKSFASLNLALSIARQRDHAVLLVDTDSAAQSLGRTLGLLKAPGLLDLALDPRIDADELITATGLEQLSVLSIGSQPDKSPELFATRKMTNLIRDLGQRYADRIVILDAAPCLSSSDPSTLASVVGQIVVVVEAERTQRAEVEAALDMLQVCPSISLLLNKAQVTTSHTFGAYPSTYSTS